MAAGAIAPLQLLCSFKSDDLLPAFKLLLDVETHYPQGKQQKHVVCFKERPVKTHSVKGTC